MIITPEQRRWSHMHEMAGRNNNGWSIIRASGQYKEQVNTEEHQGTRTSGSWEHSGWLDDDWTEIQNKSTRGWGAGGVRREKHRWGDWIEKLWKEKQRRCGGKQVWGRTQETGQLHRSKTDVEGKYEDRREKTERWTEKPRKHIKLTSSETKTAESRHLLETLSL